MAFATTSRLRVFSAATQMRPVPTRKSRTPHANDRLAARSGPSTRTCRAAGSRSEVVRSACCLQPRRDLRALRDTVAHLGEFLFPRARSSGGQHGGDHCAAVRRRVRIVRADHALELRQHARASSLLARDDRQRAHALAVQRERFRERRRHEYSIRLRRTGARRGVSVEAVAETLIGDVEERDQRTAIRGTRCATRRVRSAPVGLWQQACSTTTVPAGIVLRAEHGVEFHAARGWIVVGVVTTSKPALFEQRAVVFPARVADGDLARRDTALQEVGADLQRARAAQGLNGDTRPSAISGESLPNSSFCTALS